MKTSVLRPVDRVLLRLAAQVATPRALAVKLMLEHGELDQLVSLQTDPKHYPTADDYWLDAMVTDLLRKDESLRTTFDRKVVAEENFEKSERQCALTNSRLAPYIDFLHPEGCEAPPLAEEIEDVPLELIQRVRKKLREWLGDAPPSTWEGRFGPGATYGDRGRLATIPDKMSSRPTLTSSALPFLFQWSGTAWATACVTGLVRRDPEFVAGNRFTTVPKDATKHRGIAVEPSINVFYQLGLGRLIRRQLRRQGVDLDTAQDIHRRVACEASRDGGFATLDLSNASDTVCYNLVRLVLPKSWFQHLAMLRSPKTSFRGGWWVLEKFSSMGNGYTFELETVLFAAITAAVHEHVLGTAGKLGHDVYVYGDDIICRTSVAQEVIAALRWFGFSLNERKSFASGSFRESCGGDFFRGQPVRAHFVKEELSEPQHYIALANGLRRACQGRQDRWDRIRPAWLVALDELPVPIRRLCGPSGLGDLVIHDEDTNRWQLRLRSGIRYVRVYRPARWKRVGWEHFRTDVVLASALYTRWDERGGSLSCGRPRPPVGVTPRDSVSGYKVGWVPYS